MSFRMRCCGLFEPAGPTHRAPRLEAPAAEPAAARLCSPSHRVTGNRSRGRLLMTYVGPRLPYRRDRIVRRLEEVSDDASARIAAQAFRAWAIAEGLLAEES